MTIGRSRSRWRIIRSTILTPRMLKPKSRWSILQSIVTAARELRADLKIDPKQTMDGVLVMREPARAMWTSSSPESRDSAARSSKCGLAADGIEGVKRGFPEFDLIVRVSAAQAEVAATRIRKESEQLEKVIASSERQLGDEKFISRAPAHVVDTIREKLSGYQRAAGQTA